MVPNISTIPSHPQHVFNSFMQQKSGKLPKLGPNAEFQAQPRPNRFHCQIRKSLSGHLLIMHSMGGSHDAPVFLFEEEAVAVENETVGSVKALYRLFEKPRPAYLRY